VWHTAEELGMVGSRWFTDHPTVPLDRIVAQLNVDMIGRGGRRDLRTAAPGYVQLIGSRGCPPSSATSWETVTASGRPPFTFDYQYDATAIRSSTTAAATTTCTRASASRSSSSPPAATATTTCRRTRCSTSTSEARPRVAPHPRHRMNVANLRSA
jgi:hypothetical protein